MPQNGENERKSLSLVHKITLSVVVIWLAAVSGGGWWISERLIAAHIDNLAASAEYEAETTASVVNRLFTELKSVANMVARQGQVIQLAERYREDPPGFSELTREDRAKILTRDPKIRQVGDYMTFLSNDLRYDRIYMNNLSLNTITSSHWSDSFNIVGQIYTGRSYLINALRDGNGQYFGIARLNQVPSYFVSSRIDGLDDKPLGSVTIRLDAPVLADYLRGRHIALIVNRQGRVTTSSFPPFTLRNVAALLPPEGLQPSDGDEGPGDPLDMRPLMGADEADHWLIEGRRYLQHLQPLADSQYQLVTLASLDEIPSMRQHHFLTAVFMGAFGLVLALLGGHMATRVAERRLRMESERVLAISQAAERDLAIKVQERTAELVESNAALKAEVKRRHLLEAKLRQSLRSVNDALAQQRDFVAMVSHEFRGPLAVIAAAADNLTSSVAEGSDTRRRVDKIRRTVKRMSSLIENILAGDRLNSGRTSPNKVEIFDLNEVLHAVKAGLDDDAAQRVDFACGAAIVVKGDRILLEIVVQNLIQNALKYSAATASVTVRISAAQGLAFVNVTDHGTGVAPDDRPLIFMKYYRTSGQSASGSGLGLYISREIARQNGGDLILAASDSNGSTFCLSLPVERSASQEHELRDS